MVLQDIKLYQVDTFVVGNRLLDPDQRSVQARTDRWSGSSRRLPTTNVSTW